jgi:hypothetical protein
LLGPNPLDPAIAKLPGTRPATLFLSCGKLVTLPGTHLTQMLAFRQALDQEHTKQGHPPVSDLEWETLCQQVVFLFFSQGFLEIPIHRNAAELVFKADEFLQQQFRQHQIERLLPGQPPVLRYFPKYRVRFLSVSDPQFREQIRRRGELWRITPRPEGVKAMQERIQASRTAIQQEAIYYYNRFQGTRYLTYGNFAGLAALDDQALAAQLAEIADYLPKQNFQGERELCLWPSEPEELKRRLQETNWTALSSAALRETFEQARRAFAEATDDALIQSEPDSDPWRTRMYATLTREPLERVELFQPGVLGPEFLYRIQWLPGARIHGRECVLDPMFSEENGDREALKLCDFCVRELILNQVREFTDLEFVNIGRIPEPLGPRPQLQGRRDVFLMEIKRAARPHPNLRVIRFYKWGIREHLEQGKSLEEAYREALDYLEFCSNRRLGCQQIGLNLPRRVTVHSIGETFHRPGRRYDGAHIWSFYSERDFIAGVPTYRLSKQRLQETAYALRVADLLGSAAAANLIVARGDERSGEVIFDQGDEVIRHDESGWPVELVTCDHSGSFALFRKPLEEAAPFYAQPVNRLVAEIGRPQEFVERYLAAFQERFREIQQEYRTHQGVFQLLFANQLRDPGGSFAHRWDLVLEKLAAADAAKLVQIIREAISV